MTKNTGWPAPTFFTDAHAASMTLRDYFAARAMQGIVSQDGDLCDANCGEPSGIAYAAYHLADEMMKAREA